MKLGSWCLLSRPWKWISWLRYECFCFVFLSSIFCVMSSQQRDFIFSGWNLFKKPPRHFEVVCYCNLFRLHCYTSFTVLFYILSVYVTLIFDDPYCALADCHSYSYFFLRCLRIPIWIPPRFTTSRSRTPTSPKSSQNFCNRLIYSHSF